MQNRHHTAMTLMEVLVIVFIIVLLIGVLLPLLGAARRSARGMQNSTQGRGIHSGLVLYSQGNNRHFPGVMADGVTVDPNVGLTSQGRMQILIAENYFSLEYARSPSEAQSGTTSYALLKVNHTNDQTMILKGGRNAEWKDTTNGDAPVVSDRAVDNGGSYTHIKSIHTQPKPGVTDWRGTVAWNDNHTSFEQKNILPTKYGKAQHAADNLFTHSGSPISGDDAFMVWHGTDGL